MIRRFETYRGVVYPWNCDAMGHMNTRFYAEMFDTASSHALHEVMPAQNLKALHFGWADVRQLINYKAELAPGTLVTCVTEFEKLGGSSVSFHHSLMCTATGAEHASSDHVVVLFDLKERRSTPFPDNVRARMQSAGLLPA
jgi:acyl-CoA thioester hydrolase